MKLFYSNFRTKKFVKVTAGLFLVSVLCLQFSVGCAPKKEGFYGATYPPLILKEEADTSAPTSAPTGEATSVPAQTAAPTDVPTDVPTESPTEPPQKTFDFSGRAYCIADAATGNITMSQNKDGRLYIASITKLITALTALDYLKPDETYTVEQGWLDFLKDDDIDAYGMKEGDSFTVNDLLSMLIMRSYGDAALTLQYATQQESGRNFLELMNEKAAELGMTESHFDNSIGLDTGNGFTTNYSTAADCVKLMKAAFDNKTLFKYCCLRETKLDCGVTLACHTPIYGDAYKSPEYSLLGGKSGSTMASGFNFACVCEDVSSGKKYIIIYLNVFSQQTMNEELAEMMDFLC